MIQHPALTQKIKPTTGDPIQDSAVDVVVDNAALSNDSNNRTLPQTTQTSINDNLLTSMTNNTSLPPITNTTNVNANNSDKDHKDDKHSFKMETLLLNGNEILKNYFNPNFIKQNGIPNNLFEEAKGIILMTYWKAGLVFGASYGSGVLLCKKDEQWCGPCAVSLGGIQFGLNIGFETVDLILFINDEFILQSFEQNGVFAIGGDASIALGPFGKDNNLIAKGSKSLYSYSFNKGVYLGISLLGGNIKIENGWNNDYYQTKVDFNKISSCDVPLPNNQTFVSIIHTLDELNFGKNKFNTHIDLPSVYE